MRRYETVFILDPDLPEEARDGLFQKLSDLIAQQGGFLVDIDVWGNRKLAYEIRKKPRGFYVRLDFCGTGALVDELERNLRIDDRFLKYMTVLLDREVDLEALKAAKAEKAAAKETAAKAAAAAEAPAAEAEAAESGPEPSAPTADTGTPEETDTSDETAPETASAEEDQTDSEEAAPAVAEESVAAAEEPTETESKEA